MSSKDVNDAGDGSRNRSRPRRARALLAAVGATVLLPGCDSLYGSSGNLIAFPFDAAGDLVEARDMASPDLAPSPDLHAQPPDAGAEDLGGTTD